MRDDRSPAICLVAAGEIFGGAERQIISLVGAIRCRANITVAVFHDAVLAQRLRQKNIRVEVLAPGFAGIAVLRRLLSEVGAGVLHVHGYRASIIASLATLGRRIKIVKTVHGAPEIGSLWTISGLRARAYFGLEGWVERLIRSHLVFVTHELSQRMRAKHKSSSWSVIHNGTDIHPQGKEPRPIEFPEGKNVVLVLGRLEFVKGVDLALRAFSRVKFENAHLVIVGDGPESVSLKKLACALGIVERVTFCGFRRSVDPYLANANVLLIPSRHEGLPYTLLEAMSLGAPVVATRVGGLAEVLTHEETALLCDSGDSVGMAAGIERILRDSALAGHIAASAQNLVTTRFSSIAMAEKYLQVYLSLSV